MATIVPDQVEITNRLLENYPELQSSSTGEDDLVNEDGSAVEVPGVGNKFEVQLTNWFRNINYPVHENLTIASAAGSKTFNKDGSWTNQNLKSLPNAKYELIRGVFFNDDPNCQLFDDGRNNNRPMSLISIARFGWDYKQGAAGNLDHANLLYRSHYGDLQFLHGMGSVVGEAPSETKRKIKLWMQGMYSCYSGQNGVGPDTPLSNTVLGEFFKGKTTFKQLLMGQTPSYRTPDIGLRALGTCMHLVQDSSAKGHCRRDDNGNGAISNFHCYSGQDSDEHSRWDSEGASALDPTNINSFNKMYGGRQAITRCVSFLDAASEKRPWEEKLEKWFQDTFAISPNATGSDTTV